LYTAVAEVLAWAFRLKHVTQEGGEVPPTPEDLPIPESLAVPATDAADGITDQGPSVSDGARR
ncbi:MAG: flagellar biosynthetic protein FlhB, partial [Billgrantia sp.]